MKVTCLLCGKTMKSHRWDYIPLHTDEHGEFPCIGWGMPPAAPTIPNKINSSENDVNIER